MKKLSFSLIGLCAALYGLIWLITYHPQPVQAEPIVSPIDAPILEPGQTVKVLTWNVQYMAGKNYFFYYDILDFSGPDEIPSKEDIAKTFLEVARIIAQENPDIILLQEMEEGSKRTYYQDQTAELLKLLPSEYQSHSSTFYWKNAFCPHPRILGATGMKLSVISKYKINKATRYSLADIDTYHLKKLFNFRRAVQAVSFPVKDQMDLVVYNTHLSAFGTGDDVKEKQAKQIGALFDGVNQKGNPWFAGGDFNLIPPGQYDKISPEARSYYSPESELCHLTGACGCIPSEEDINSDNCKKWFTHFSNNPIYSDPDRTIDYFFYSDRLGLDPNYRVRNEDTRHISDHFPLIARFKLPDS